MSSALMIATRTRRWYVSAFIVHREVAQGDVLTAAHFCGSWLIVDGWKKRVCCDSVQLVSRKMDGASRLSGWLFADHTWGMLTASLQQVVMPERVVVLVEIDI